MNCEFNRPPQAHLKRGARDQCRKRRCVQAVTDQHRPFLPSLLHRRHIVRTAANDAEFTRKAGNDCRPCLYTLHQEDGFCLRHRWRSSMHTLRLTQIAGVAALFIGAATAAASPAQAYVGVNLGIGVPSPVYAAPPSVVSAPPPVYAAPSPFVAGVPLYGSFGFGYGGWHGGHGGWHH